jgi:hypothetical protein
MPAEELMAAMPFSPASGKTAGEPRQTPKGTPLEGHYRESTCACDVGKGEDGELATLLRQTMDVMDLRRDVLHDLQAQGATFAFYVTWRPDGDSGETFDADLLHRMGELGIALGLNVLP